MDDELIPSFKKSLFNNIGDIGADLLELPIDLFTENEVIKDIPVVGTIVKLGKTVGTIRDRYLIKKLIIFIKSVNDGTVESDIIKNHKEILESDPKKLNEELENVMILVDRELEIDKTKILAELYKAYICKKIHWSDFTYLSEMLERLCLRDIDSLSEIYETGHAKKDKFGVFRLEAVGLVKYFSKRTNSAAYRSGLKQAEVELTGYGKLFYQYGLKKLIDNGDIGVWF